MVYIRSQSFHLLHGLSLKIDMTLLDSGAALGFGCGPLLVARSNNISVEDALIAVPGS